MISILGQNIKRIRNSKKMTQKELSLRAGVGQSTITEIENGTRQNLRADSLGRIANALLVSTNQLLSIEEDKEYEIKDIQSAIEVIFADDNNLELDNKPLSPIELDLIKMQLETTLNMIRIQRGDN